MLAHDMFNARDLLSFPKGDNDTDTVFGGVHFNTSTLDHWNYTYYDGNRTLSNGSRCYLAYEPYQPVQLFTNGTFVNSTKCYSAVDPIRGRGYTGIGVAGGYALALLLTITALAKHGPNYLPRDSRFYPIGRRWQWYWGIFVCAAALIGLFTNIDVDRYHVPELPLILTTFFWYLMCMGTTAQVWEAVRHWGSWQERQYIDPNQFVYAQDDRRAKTEFWLPLWFYFWTWMNFFLVVPRNWSFVYRQRYPGQAEAVAVPSATSPRFKAAAFTLVVSWLTICYSLRHSIKFYKPRNRGVFNRSIGFFRSIPLRFVLIIPLSAALIAYQAIISWNFNFSLIKVEPNVPVVYAWGYGPSLLILFVQVIYGYASPNEDKELIRQRRERGEMLDRELGLVKKPAWWRRVRGDHMLSMRDKIRGNVQEVGGTSGVGRRVLNAEEAYVREQMLRNARDEDDIELRSFPGRESDNPRLDRAGAKTMDHTTAEDSSSPFSDNVPQPGPVSREAGIFVRPATTADERARRAWELMQDGPPPPYNNDRRSSTGTSNSITAAPQQVRSMLDI